MADMNITPSGLHPAADYYYAPNINHGLLDDTPPQSSSPLPHLLSEESSFDPYVPGSGDIDNFLSRSSLDKLRLECYDECVYNDLPQYLVRISDMRLYSRRELWKVFRPLIDTIAIDLEKARLTIKWAGDVQLRKNYKVF